jgi:small-conductance mechanosensitive channel
MSFQQVVAWFNSLSPDMLARALRVALTVVLGFVVVRLIAAFTQRYLMKKSTPQRRMIARKAVSYTGFVLVLMAVLGELGVKLTALLGAAGIVAVAVGFASQTSVSNIISGLFLISEKPFAIGDVIKIGGTTGIIQSIDLLSIKIRTFDNMFVRIPNEKILTSEVTNITRFPIRRMDITLQVSYDEDLDRVRAVLNEIAVANPWCLDEPAPVIVLGEFKESGIDLLFGLWFSKTDFLDLKNSIMNEILTRFRAEGIRIPYPHRTVVLAGEQRAGAAAKRMPAAVPARRRRRRIRGVPRRATA